MFKKSTNEVRWQYPSLSPEEKRERYEKYRQEQEREQDARYYEHWLTLPTRLRDDLSYDRLCDLGATGCLPVTKMQQAIEIATERLLASDKARFVADAVTQLQHFVAPVGNSVGVGSQGDLGKTAWHPMFLAKMSVEHTAYAICHEAAHLALDSQRTAVKCHGYTPQYDCAMAFNVAADLEIEQLLSELRDIRIPKIYVIGGFCDLLNVTLDLPEGLTTEGYYEYLVVIARSRSNPYQEARRRLGYVR